MGVLRTCFVHFVSLIKYTIFASISSALRQSNLTQVTKFVNVIGRKKNLTSIYREQVKLMYRPANRLKCTLKPAVQTRWNSGHYCILTVVLPPRKRLVIMDWKARRG